MSAPYRFYNLYNSGKRIPIIGRWLGRVGYAVEILSMPCTVEPEIWFFAAFYNIPTVFFMFVKPTPMDWATRHLRRKGKRWKITDPYANIGSGEIHPKGPYGWFVVRGIFFGRYIGYWLTVGDAASGFVLNWVSTAYEWKHCSKPNDGYGCLIMTRGSIPELLPAASGRISSWIHVAGSGVGAGPIGFSLPKHAIPTFTILINQDMGHYSPLPDCQYEIQLQHNDQLIESDSYTRVDQDNGGTQYQYVFKVGSIYSKYKPKDGFGGQWSIHFHKTFGVWEIGEAVFQCTTTSTKDHVGEDP